MNKDDLIFTLKATALGVIALVMYIAVSYLRGGGRRNGPGSPNHHIEY
jgi:hypothetical protein